MKRMGMLAIAAAALGVCSARSALADVACLQQAKASYAACKTQCQDDYRSAKFICRGIEPACGKACLAGREVCTDAVEDILTTGQLPGSGALANCSSGTAACKDTLRAARAACGTPCDQNPDPVACDACVDTAQVAAFICRDTCRDSWRHDPTVMAMKDQCRSIFQACVAACPRIGS